MTAECVIFMIGVIVQISASSAWTQFAVGRLISGLGVGALSAAVPMVSWSSPYHVTSAAKTSYQFSIKLKLLRLQFGVHLPQLTSCSLLSVSLLLIASQLAHGI